MFEIEIMNKETKEIDIVIGYNFKEACESAGLDITKWVFVYKWYID